MAKMALFTFVLMFSFLTLIGQQKWQIFNPEAQLFEVYVPGEMKNAQKNLLTEVGQLKNITWLYQGAKEDPNFIYSLSYVDYPNGTFHLDSTDLITEFFEVSIQANIEDLNGELAYKSDAPHGGFPSMLYRVSYNENKAVLKSRMVLVGDRFYALQVYTTSDKSLNPEMDKFLDSFKIKLKK